MKGVDDTGCGVILLAAKPTDDRGIEDVSRPTSANSVSDGPSFIASIEPKTAFAFVPLTSRSAATH